MSSIITVFGATGNQGGSVIQHLLADPVLSNEYRIRGITRDVSKPAAQDLVKRGVEMVSADLNSKDSLTAALAGSHTVFLVTNYWESMSKETEVAQGKTVTDVAKQLGVQHLIFSSLLHVSETTKGRLPNVPHFDGKAEIERYIRASGVPATFFLPGYFMSNLEQMVKQSEDGVFTLAYPVGENAKFPLLAVREDTGKFVKAIITSRSNVLGARILGAAAYYTAPQILAQIAETTGKRTQFVQLGAEAYKGLLPAFMAQEALENHLFIEEPGYYDGESLDESHGILDVGLTSWKDFVAKSEAFKA